MEFKNGDHVLCERLGPGEFDILSQNDREYEVRSINTGKVSGIFKVHCHATVAMRFASHKRKAEAKAAQIEKNQQIGRNLRRR